MSPHLDERVVSKENSNIHVAFVWTSTPHCMYATLLTTEFNVFEMFSLYSNIHLFACITSFVPSIGIPFSHSSPSLTIKIIRTSGSV